ncbi:MAG: nucleotidyl transferase AbiEii/AbiGii toxin family protein [Acidimicrobiales bacterium]
MSVLQRWVREAEADTGIAVARQQRWVSYMVLASMLDTARDDGGAPLFLLKGGVAMELRFDVAARATKDLDLVYRQAGGRMLGRLDEALARGHGDFTARRTEAERVRGTQAMRADVKLDYRGKRWATVQIEISPAEPGVGDEIDHLPAKPLEHLGLTGPDEVPAVSVRWQLAQKLHACTEPPAAGSRNERFRDLIDIVLLWDLVATEARPSVREACEQIFELRALHPWPPRVQPPADWARPYRQLATEIRFPLDELDAAADAVHAVVDEIARA